MGNYTDKIIKNQDRAVSAGLFSPSSIPNPACYLKDNRPGSVVQKKQIHNLKEINRASLTFSQLPVQLVSYNDLWVNQQNIYQPNTVGTARIPGDAEWLAIRRYCKSVKPTKHDTVNDVLVKASARKKVSFHDWKGNQATGDSQEAQHLISASYATKTLKLPYSLINSPENGKMLLAGRKGKGLKAPSKYIKAKKARNKKPNRGVLHIKSGIAHPHYEKNLKKYVTNFYNSKGITIGGGITKKHFIAMTTYLRQKHKALDGKNTTGQGVDDLMI